MHKDAQTKLEASGLVKARQKKKYIQIKWYWEKKNLDSE